VVALEEKEDTWCLQRKERHLVLLLLLVDTYNWWLEGGERWIKKIEDGLERWNFQRWKENK
jgi:hypothetical protein